MALTTRDVITQEFVRETVEDKRLDAFEEVGLVKVLKPIVPLSVRHRIFGIVSFKLRFGMNRFFRVVNKPANSVGATRVERVYENRLRHRLQTKRLACAVITHAQEVDVLILRPLRVHLLDVLEFFFHVGRIAHKLAACFGFKVQRSI